MSKDKQEPRYIQIPLCWLQMIWKDPKKALEEALCYGIVYRSRKVKYSAEQVAKQLVYDYYRSDLIYELENQYHELVEAEEIPDYGEDNPGFTPQGFDPDESPEVVEAFKKYPDFEKLAIQNYQIHVSAYYLNLKIKSKAYTIKRAAVVQSFQDQEEQRFDKQPMPMVNVGLVLKFRDNPENIELLTSYIAIKSLIGQHKFTGTHRLEVARRMIGAKSNAALPEALEDPILKTIYQKYTKRWQFDKLIAGLLEGNFIKSKIGYGHRGHKQGIYFSMVYDYCELTEEIDKATRIKCHKSQEKKAQEELKKTVIG
jgi:hypothetical protein